MHQQIISPVFLHRLLLPDAVADTAQGLPQKGQVGLRAQHQRRAVEPLPAFLQNSGEGLPAHAQHEDGLRRDVQRVQRPQSVCDGEGGPV